MGKSLRRRGYSLEEQIELFRQLWAGDRINFLLAEERFEGVGISPRPNGGTIPIWIGVSPELPVQALERLGRLADGWFTMCRVDQFASQNKVVLESVKRSGRSISDFDVEAEVSIADLAPDNLISLVKRWQDLGISHIILSALGLEGDSSSPLAGVYETGWMKKGFLKGHLLEIHFWRVSPTCRARPASSSVDRTQ